MTFYNLYHISFSTWLLSYAVHVKQEDLGKFRGVEVVGHLIRSQFKEFDNEQPLTFILFSSSSGRFNCGRSTRLCVCSTFFHCMATLMRCTECAAMWTHCRGCTYCAALWTQ